MGVSQLKAVTIRFKKDTYEKLQILSQQRGEPVAVVVRRMVEEFVANEMAVAAVDVVATMLRKTIRSELKLTEDRLAKLAAKAATAAATSMYLNTQALRDLGKHDALELYQAARKKAVAYLREPDVDDDEE
jgi:predicted DNA-binding protein